MYGCHSKNYIMRWSEKCNPKVRWSTFFLYSDNHNASSNGTLDFKSRKASPMANFENAVLDLVWNVHTKPKTSKFHQQLSKDRTTVKKESNTLGKMDKTTNYYKMKPEEYKRIVSNNITKTTKKRVEKYCWWHTTNQKKPLIPSYYSTTELNKLAAKPPSKNVYLQHDTETWIKKNGVNMCHVTHGYFRWSRNTRIGRYWSESA